MGNGDGELARVEFLVAAESPEDPVADYLRAPLLCVRNHKEKLVAVDRAYGRQQYACVGAQALLQYHARHIESFSRYVWRAVPGLDLRHK